MNLEQHLDTSGHHPPTNVREVGRRLALFLNVVDAVRDAHARGERPIQIHPGSFLVLPDESRGVPRVRLADSVLVPSNDLRLPRSPELVEVHRLGVILYQLMSRRPGLDDGRDDERRLDEGAVDSGLREVILRALAPNPEHRFASIDALGDAVRGLAGRAPAPGARSRVVAGIGLALGGLLLVAGAQRLAVTRRARSDRAGGAGAIFRPSMVTTESVVV